MTSHNVRVRFAPSPTGFLHVGGARTALYNWLLARHTGGRFVLRIEDTDRRRYDPQALPDLLASLRWLGLCWDEGPEVGGKFGPYYQSDRVSLYREHADELVTEGHAYQCYCTPERLAALREEQRAAKISFGYDRLCRQLTAKEIAENQAQGNRAVIRLAVPREGATEFDDLLRGHISVENRQLDDLVLLKSDGYPTYHLANVVDDHYMQISHILRGDEWLSSVPKHVLLYDAFGWEMPIQAHLPTILDPSGKGKLSKRKKPLPDGRQMLTLVHEFREGGYLPEAMVNFLALVGWSYDGETEFLDRDDIVQGFDLERVNKSPASFSYDKLDHMNATYIRELGSSDLAGRLLGVLAGAGVSVDIGMALRLVPLIKERMTTLKDVVPHTDFFFSDPLEYDPQVLIQKGMDAGSTRAALEATVLALEPLEAFGEDVLETVLRDLTTELGLKARQLFGCIRVACTGKKVAPPLFGTLSILDKDEVLRRLRAAVAGL